MKFFSSLLVLKPFETINEFRGALLFVQVGHSFIFCRSTAHHFLQLFGVPGTLYRDL